MTFLEEEPAVEVFKRGEVPGEFQLSSTEFRLDGEDMGICKLIAVIHLGHLSRKLDGNGLEKTLSFRPEKTIRDVRSDDSEGDKFLSFCQIEGARGRLGFHSPLFCPDIINPPLPFN